MKVLDLQCTQRHAFEGWFASEQDFQEQKERGLIECPLCADKVILKMLSAPRLNFGAPAPRISEATSPPVPQETEPAAAQEVVVSTSEREMQAAALRVLRRMVANTEDVGERFAEEARRMHYGETDERGIRGRATREETEALIEEGIPVMPVPMSDLVKETLQ